MNICEDKDLFNSCTGCGLCIDCCPTGALTYLEDKNHFLYPYLDNKKCSNCGLCTKMCPILNIKKYSPNKAVQAHSFRINDMLEKSASGGAFQTFARYVLNEGGIVYGVTFDDRFNAVYKRIIDTNDLFSILGSKYVQATLSKTILSSLKEDVNSNKFVLFCGTPCQIAMINAYFVGSIPENLFLIDLICHGVPNNWALKTNLQYIEKFHRTKITFFKFRYKNQNKHDRQYEIHFLNNKKIIGYYWNLLYYRKFHEYSIFRNSCYQCKFRNNRYSDFTIGDFWGIEKIDSNFENGNNLSLILSNTKKAICIQEEVFSNGLIWQKYNVKKSISLNYSYCYDIKIEKKDYSFYKNIGDYKYAISEYKEAFKHSKKLKIRNKLKTIINKILHSNLNLSNLDIEIKK